ncbi:MAG: hypothetical protein IK093_03860, partial [Ruminiclostridium sp.]|nr:hypothetical protein [Ruminiclostridium sp.]
QLNLEMMETRTDAEGLRNITRIWSSFHFLPYDLYAEKKNAPKMYLNKYRLICDTDSDLLVETVKLAKGGSLQAAGIAMHVLADTWAHRYFAGTPSLVINNTDYCFYELVPSGEGYTERQVQFRHDPSAPDDPEKGIYINSIYQSSENSIMNLGHGRAGHLPDYSYARYKYLPAWGDYREKVKDNPSDYMNAFCQMIYALKFLRGSNETFEKKIYDTAAVKQWEDEIRSMLEKRRTDACEDWRRFGKKLSGMDIEDFDIEKYQSEYMEAADKNDTFLGRFISGALAQKNMVTYSIYRSGNKLAGESVVRRRSVIGERLSEAARKLGKGDNA